VSESRHPGISYHKLPVGGDLGGLLVIIGAFAAVGGKAHLWWFVLISLPLGLVLVLLLRFFYRRAKPPISLNL